MLADRFLAADVGTSAAVHKDIEVVSSATRVLADEPLLVGLADGDHHVVVLVVELATDVDVCRTSTCNRKDQNNGHVLWNDLFDHKRCIRYEP